MTKYRVFVERLWQPMGQSALPGGVSVLKEIGEAEASSAESAVRDVAEDYSPMALFDEFQMSLDEVMMFYAIPVNNITNVPAAVKYNEYQNESVDEWEWNETKMP